MGKEYAVASDSGPIPSVVLLAGDDTISRERAREQVLDRIRSERGDITVEAYDSDQSGVGEFAERILTPSLFGGVRVFTIRHLEQLGEPDLSSLLTVAGYGLTDEYLLMEADKASERTAKAFASFRRKLGTMAKKKPETVSVVSFSKPPDYRIAEWLASNVPTLLGRSIRRQEAELLVDLVGADFDTLRAELDKVDLFLEPGEAVTVRAINEVVEGTRAAAGYELAQALGAKDLARAMTVLDSLFSTSFYAPSCLWALHRHFWALYRIRAFAERSPETIDGFERAQRSRDRNAQSEFGVAIGVAAGLMAEGQGNRVYPMLIKPKLVEQARSFADTHLRAVFRWLRDIDVGVKTGWVDATLPMMQAFCVRVVRGPSCRADLDAYTAA